MRHRYPIKIYYSDEDGGYIATIPDLPGCSAYGDTEEAAIKEAKIAVSLWVKVAKKEKRTIPPPSAIPSFSGKFMARVPKSLHQKLAEKASDEGVSLNQYVEYLLAKGVGGI